jgi:PhoH-like ATPase
VDAAYSRRPRAVERPEHGERKPSDRRPHALRFDRRQALSYIRGRSISNRFVVIDEVQNLTPLEIKTIITRVARHQIVFTGDLTD